MRTIFADVQTQIPSYIISGSSTGSTGSTGSTISNTSASLGRTGEQLITQLKSPSGLAILGCLGVFLLLQLLGNKSKGQVATGYWGGGKEKNRAAKRAKQQIASPTRNNVALYIGMPDIVCDRLDKEWKIQGFIKHSATGKKKFLSRRSPTLYVPDVQRGVSVVGAAGTGKTFSVLDPLIRATLDQGFPMCLYDFKYPAQTKRCVAYALKRGYTVRVFAPGFPESETCNPLDLLKNEEDAIAAGQLAQVISKNFDRSGGKASSDKFFEEAGDSLIEGVFLVTKAVATLVNDDKYCDLMMAQAILSLTSLPLRMEAASKSQLKVWTTRPLSQLISVKDSEKTVSSIVGTAQRMFQRFLKKDFIGAFCGKTTLPLDLDGKQLIIFGLDRNNRDIVGPLLAAILHTIVTRNVSRTVSRKDPLVVALDELPTLYLPALVNWLNENREDGFCGLLGYQNVAQLENAYGKELSRAIIGGTASKFIFNPQDPDSAKFFADYLGEMEIRFESKSRSHGKGSNSRSHSEHHQKRHLLEPAQFLKMETGRAVIVSPAYHQGQESYVPLLQKIKVPANDITEMNWSEAKWDFVRERLISTNAQQITEDERRAEFEERRALAEQLFPLPQGESSESQDFSQIF